MTSKKMDTISCKYKVWGNLAKLRLTFFINSYETSDGQKRDETGTLKDAPPTPENPNNKVIDIIGSYEFTSPEGNSHFY